MVRMHALRISQSNVCAYFLARRSPRGGIHNLRVGFGAFWSKRSMFNQITVCTITIEEHIYTFIHVLFSGLPLGALVSSYILTEYSDLPMDV